MSKVLKEHESLPEVLTYRSFEEQRALADQTLNCKEKMIYYLGGVENLTDVFSEEYERDFLHPHPSETGDRAEADHSGFRDA